MDISEKELEILEFWNKNKIFEASLEKTKKGKPYIFYDGPPFATGTPHYGHLLGSIAKDLFARYWTMKGYFVKRVWGWDCHGLPIENIAEKSLGINSKDEIDKMGVKKFNDYCRSKVLGYADEWEKVIDRIGRWVDMKNSYKTMDNSYIESVWWAFKTLWEKDYIYEGEKILMYCPRCSTPLSKSEIAMDNSYKMVKDNTAVVKFVLKKEMNGKQVSAIAWTTTPWTLPSNLAIAVNPKLEYVYVKDNSDDMVYLLGSELVNNFWKDKKDYKILKKVKGSELEGIEYEPLFDYFAETKNAFKIILGDFVEMEETGIVHIAPNFGEDDYEVCKKYKISTVDSVDEKGNFTKNIKDFAGEYVHDTNSKIIENLKSRGLIVLIKKIEHEYPFCYRCDTKLIYKSLPAWFVDIEKIKPRLLELNQKLNWHPNFLKDGRVKYSIETAPDWNITRNRYWASAIPIWVNEDGEKIIIGSIDELKKLAKNLPSGEINLHKDFLDEVILEKDGKKYKRIPEVIDCWFESGSMPFAQFHYPFENKEYFENNFPAQYVVEYIGQTRAWFYYMNVLSAILFDDIPVENYVTTGTILTEDGQKMSKSKQNYTDPMILIEKFGVDTLRFYLMSSPVMGAENINFSDKSVEEIYKKVLLLLYNVSKFYSEHQTPNSKIESNSKKTIDKWIISRLNETGKNVSKYYEEYNTIKACSEIRTFIDDLSTWYVRLIRERVNDGDDDALNTLMFVLDRLSKISAPIIPFISESIFQILHGKKGSVHLSDYPNFEPYSEKLNAEMNIVREIVSMGLKSRDQNQVGLKWPLSLARVSSPEKLSEEMINIVKQELNIKQLEITEGSLNVELDFTINDELEKEGFAREISRKIQAGRKKIGLIKSDKIVLKINKEFKKNIEGFISFITERVGTNKIIFGDIEDSMDFIEDGRIKNHQYKLGISKK